MRLDPTGACGTDRKGASASPGYREGPEKSVFRWAGILYWPVWALADSEKLPRQMPGKHIPGYPSFSLSTSILISSPPFYMVFYPTPLFFTPFTPCGIFLPHPFTPPQIEGVLSIINVSSALASAALPVYNIHQAPLRRTEKSPAAFDRRRGICYNKSTKRDTTDRRSALFNYSIK